MNKEFKDIEEFKDWLEFEYTGNPEIKKIVVYFSKGK